MPGDHIYFETVTVPSLLPKEDAERLRKHFEEYKRKLAEDGISEELQQRLAEAEHRAFIEGTK